MSFQIYVQTENSRYVSLDADGHIVSNKSELDNTCYFDAIMLDDNYVAFKATNNMFISYGDGKKIKANKQSIDETCRFKFQFLSLFGFLGDISCTTMNGKYLSRVNYGGSCDHDNYIEASKDKFDGACSFRVSMHLI